MATPQNVELEAAKFLHKLIQESKDEPTKLATKLYVILQHMRSSGKENSMPYQVISRAMETVINQHGLDIEVLMSSRLPLTSGTQVGDSASSQFAGSSQITAAAKDSKASLAENEMAKTDAYASSRPSVGPNSAGHDIYQSSVSHLNSKPFDHESPSSFDTRSANSQSQEMRDSPNWEKVNEKDSKRASSKRKRADSSLVTETHISNLQLLDSHNLNSRMDKVVNTTNSMSRPPNLKHPEDIEVSSAHNALSLQQGGSLHSTHDVLSSRGLRTQNKTGLPFEKSQVSRFSFHAAGNSAAEILVHQSSPSSLGPGAVSKGHGATPGTLSSHTPLESGIPSPQFSSSYDNHGLVAKMHKDRSMEAFSAMHLVELSAGKGTGGKALEHKGEISNMLANANKTVQGGIPNNVSEMTLRHAASRDTGKSQISQAPAVYGMPFKEQHLKQLRAQCLVFLAFRNGLMPKKLHLEIALGSFFPKEDGPRTELINHKGKEQSIGDPSSIPELTMPFRRLDNARGTERILPGPSSTGIYAEGHLVKEAENPNMMEDKNGPASGLSEHAEERRYLLMTRRKEEPEMHTQEIAKSHTFATEGLQPDSSSVRGLALSNHKDDLENRNQQAGMIDQASSVMGIGQQMKQEMIGWTGNGCHNEVSKVPLPTTFVLPESVPEREDNAPCLSRSLGDCDDRGNLHADGRLPSFSLAEHWKPLSGMGGEHHSVIPVMDANVSLKYVSQDDPKISHKRLFSDGYKMVPVEDVLKNGNPVTVLETDKEKEDISVSTDMPPSPKYTTSENWIMDQQKRKHLSEQKWALKQLKTEQRITACSDKLKETVSSSEDISAKTRSVIELKKLQLLELQCRLRSDILNDFFKPIATEMDRLKSIKKHRIGRRSKQLEKYEQKMKEERQKRIRERQKEFFSEIEVHKERLEDVFKTRRERWKGFNKFVREFHKRKERIHREKIDRIQREKINLLKINDVEGYLRMVQDAKSDRVKQLLKETEKYLQKLGSKLRDAKAIGRCFETDMDESRTASIFEKNEIALENEDETDQAKHYMESNEKYYLMAHSIKENVAEQPTCLVGGTLREYQMNGLRWLVSLYNNHLNGILADEMGLGKTVQVISLICYLMETKNDRGPFLVVVPSSVLPGWESEINFWAPSINRIVYSGPPEERRKLFKERIVPQKFNVLLTTYEYLMNKHDRPKLSKIDWHYVIIDEGHRIKNASCKLNADLKHYRSSHRLLLTGTPLQNNLEELWALLNFLLPNIFNSSDDFSQWFNKPFESNGDNSADEALLSEEENLLIINRLHQVLRPFVLRRLKHKVENQLPEKIERLVRCEASAYQKLLMKRVEENLGAFRNSKARSLHNSVMQLRNICNHPYLSQLHVEEVHDLIPKHYLPNMVRLCGKLEMLDRLLPKLKATDHRVLLFSTMTRLLDVMEDYLCWKQYRYLRLDGHTSGGDRGALIDQFNQPGSPFFIFLLSIRAGGVGVNLQAADTVIIFDTDWNPQVDLQAQARAHRIGQKKDVLVLRLETVQTVEEQVRAAAEHKLGVANQSITAGFFDNNTSAEDRREYLESLLRECKKEEAAPVLNDDALNDLLARSELEIDIFESIDKKRLEEEMAVWKKLVSEQETDGSEPVPPMPSRLVTDDDLKPFCEAMKISEVPKPVMVSQVGLKRKGQYLGGLDTQHYGRGKRAREVRSYEEQWSEDEFEKICQVDSPESPKLLKEEVKEQNLPMVASESITVIGETEIMAPPKQPSQASVELPTQQSQEVTPPSRRGRGRPKKAAAAAISPSPMALPGPSGAGKMDIGSQRGTVSSCPAGPGPDSLPSSTAVRSISGTIHQFGVWIAPNSESNPHVPSVSLVGSQLTTTPCPSISLPARGRGRKAQSGAETPNPRRRGKKQSTILPTIPVLPAPSGTEKPNMGSQEGMISGFPIVPPSPNSLSGSTTVKDASKEPGSLSPVVPVLLASSGTADSNMESQRGLVSSSPTVPGSSILAGISGTVHDLGVGNASSSEPTPPSPSQSTPALNLSMDKSENQPGKKVANEEESEDPVMDEAVDSKPHSTVNQSLKEKSFSSLSTLEAAATPAFELPMDKSENPAGGDVKQDTKDPVLTDSLASKPEVMGNNSSEEKAFSSLSTLEMAAPILEPALDNSKGQSRIENTIKQESGDPVLANSIVSKPEVTESRSEENVFSTSTLEMSAPIVEPAFEKSEDQSGGKIDANQQESREPVLDEGQTDKSKIESEKEVEAGQESKDSDLSEAVLEAEACEPETKPTAGSYGKIEDSGKLNEDDSVMGSYNVTSTAPINANSEDDVTCKKPPALNNSCMGVSSCQVRSPSTSDGATNNEKAVPPQ